MKPLSCQLPRSSKRGPHVGRHLGSRDTAEMLLSDPSFPPIPTLNSPLPTTMAPLTTIMYSSQKWLVYINEAMCKSRRKCNFAVYDLKWKTKSVLPGPMIDALRYVITTTDFLKLILWLTLKNGCERHCISIAYNDHTFCKVTHAFYWIFHLSIFPQILYLFMLSWMFPYFISLLFSLFSCIYIGTAVLSCTLFREDYIILIGLIPDCLTKILISSRQTGLQFHDDVIKWKHFPRYWPFERGIHRSPVNSPHKGQWRGALVFSLICVWINGCVNNREAGDWRCYRAHYDVIVMWNPSFTSLDMMEGVFIRFVWGKVYSICTCWNMIFVVKWFWKIWRPGLDLQNSCWINFLF